MFKCLTRWLKRQNGASLPFVWAKPIGTCGFCKKKQATNMGAIHAKGGLKKVVLPQCYDCSFLPVPTLRAMVKEGWA